MIPSFEHSTFQSKLIISFGHLLEETDTCTESI